MARIEAKSAVGSWQLARKRTQSKARRSRGQKTREQAIHGTPGPTAGRPPRRTYGRLQGKSKPLKSHRRSRTTKKPSPGEFALRQRTLPGRRFVEFPLVHGKIADKVQLFTTTNCHSLTIEFQDQTSLHLDIEPGFTVHTQFMQSVKGELETLAEWPPIHISAQEP